MSKDPKKGKGKAKTAKDKGGSTGHSHPPYFLVFVLLAVLTVVEIWISGLDISKSRQITVLMAFATGKALLVVLYYMHLRYESRILSYVLLIPLAIALMFVFVLFL
jgi:cytochrome c oxidase subunit 4